MAYNKKNRPVYLNLFAIRLPITGIVSIIHRVTGVLLVLLSPVMVYFLQRSLQSEADFNLILECFSSLPARLLLLGVLWLFAQHFFSGIRHLLQDLDIGITQSAASKSSFLILACSFLTVVLIGYLIL